MVASAAAFSLMAAMAKLLLPHTPTQAVVLSRGVLMTAVIVMLARRRGVSLVGTRPWRLLMRGLLGYAGRCPATSFRCSTYPWVFRIVLGRAPTMYDEIWTAGKVMYKLEQVVADQGTLIIYAPHIREVSRTWGRYIEAVGYHIREYLLAHMDRLRDVPRGVLAHLTNVRGTGTYAGGVEKPVVDLIFATSIPEDVCRRINVGYLDASPHPPGGIHESGSAGILFVVPAGEVLYRVMGQPAEKE